MILFPTDSPGENAGRGQHPLMVNIPNTLQVQCPVRLSEVQVLALNSLSFPNTS